MMTQAEPELCRNCGHERGYHYDEFVSRFETTTKPYMCTCARFVPKEAQAKDTRMTFSTKTK